VNDVIKLGNLYAYTGSLPKGCIYCGRGGKVVVFITGLCSERCFYCPVSGARLYRDVVFADEESVNSLEDVIDEVYRVGADGIGITGGDPLMVVKRTVNLIERVKDYFGPDFHVHLYTSGRYLTVDALLELERAGLDELRLHPVSEEHWAIVERVASRNNKFLLGLELPMFPGKVEELWQKIMWLERMGGVSFINLNEVEVSERNINAIRARGYAIDAVNSTVKGSGEASLLLLERAAKAGVKISIHYCSASFKDRVQLRSRLLRKALRLAYPFQKVTATGLLEHMEMPLSSLGKYEELVKTCIDAGLGGTSGQRVMLHPSCRKLGIEGSLVRQYPVESSKRIVFEST